MSIFIIDANGTEMGEYRAATAQDALEQFAQDAGYDSIADMTEVTGIDSNVLICQINTEALVNDYSAKTGKTLFQDSYGDGVAVLADGTRFDCYADIALAIDMTLDDFVMSRISQDNAMYADIAA